MRVKRSPSPSLIAAGLVAGLVATALVHADSNTPPSDGAVAFATRTSDLLLNTLFAALTQEFNETTPANVEEGKRSISLVFNDANSDMRLVGTNGPLRENDRPADDFEQAALGLALTGQAHTSVERAQGRWYYRRSIPLSNFRSECAMCHANFPPGPTPDWMGALMLRVPIN